MQKSHIGFQFVPFPQEIWDEQINMTLGEFRLFGYLLRYHVQWGLNRQIRFTDDELLRGRKRKGERLDKGCGIHSAGALRVARENLIAKKWIEYEVDNSDAARPKRYYSLNARLFEHNNTDLTEEDRFKKNTQESTSKDLESFSKNPVSENDSWVNIDDSSLHLNDSEVSLNDTQLSPDDTRSEYKSLSVKVDSKSISSRGDVDFSEVREYEPETNLTDEDRFGCIEEFVRMYNNLSPVGCPRVTKITPARRQRYGKYLELFPSKKYWYDVFVEMCFSDFLRGLKTGITGAIFKPDLDWLCQRGQSKNGDIGIENCEKVHKTQYRDEAGQERYEAEKRLNVAKLSGPFSPEPQRRGFTMMDLVRMKEEKLRQQAIQIQESVCDEIF